MYRKHYEVGKQAVVDVRKNGCLLNREQGRIEGNESANLGSWMVEMIHRDSREHPPAS